MRFQNGCNKMAIELQVVQFWSEIILVISNRTCTARSFYFEIMCMISDQIALHSVQLQLFTGIVSMYKSFTSSLKVWYLKKMKGNQLPIWSFEIFVPKVENAIHQINHYSADSIVWFVDWITTYPVDSIVQPSNNWALIF